MPQELRRRRATYMTVAVASAAAWMAAVLLMGTMHDGMSAGPLRVSFEGVVLLTAMWMMMMVAMMLPSTSPMIATVVGLAQRTHGSGCVAARAVAFTAGYLLAWGGFSLVAASAQQMLSTAGLLSHGRIGPAAAGSVLIAAGVYQLLPAKQSCLTRCRSPLGFLLTHWREGHAGVFAMGVRHGLWCLGCCVALMSMLFAVGVMHLGWMVALTVLVLAEKVMAYGHVLARVAGAALAAYGLWILTT